MQNFKLNKTDLLGAQDWTFPTFTAYGPGRFKEIGNFCKNFNIQNVLIVTDSGSIKLPFISDLQNLLLDSKIKSNIYSNISPNPRMPRPTLLSFLAFSFCVSSAWRSRL